MTSNDEHAQEPQAALTMAQLGDATRENIGDLLTRYGFRIRARVIAAGVYEDIDDVVQETFIRLLKAIGRSTWPNVESFRKYVAMTARSAATDHLRQRGRQPRRFDSVIVSSETAGPADERLRGPSATPSAIVSAREAQGVGDLRARHEARLAKVAALREPDQILVAMAEGGAAMWAAIAEELTRLTGVQVGADGVRMRYSRLVRDRIGEPLPAIADGDLE